MRRWTGLIFAIAATLLGGAPALAFPDRTVRIVVPFPAGGSNDVLARILAQRLSEVWKQSVIVDNRPGAGGNVGAEAVARGEPDGYTVLLSAPGPLAINQTLVPSYNLDAIKDLKPIALIASVPIVLAVNPEVKANTVAELVAMAKAKPGALNFGSSGIGSTNHLAGELFKSLTGIDIVHVPYRGAAPAMNDLVAGHIPFMFDNMPAVKPQIDGGRIRGLAVAGAKRSPLLPDLPTMAEAGVAGFDASAWFGLLAPAGTPEEAVDVMTETVRTVLAEPGTAEQFGKLGAEPGRLFGPAFGVFLREEAAKWSGIVKSANIQVN